MLVRSFTTYKGRWLILLLAGLAVTGFFLADLDRFLTLDAIKAQQATVDGEFSRRPLLVGGLYLLAFTLATAFSLPAAGIMSLGSGAFFGFWWGTLIATLGTTFGATGAFLMARYLFRDTVQERFGDRLAKINRGVEEDGGVYLFSLRLLAVLPFFILNAVIALSSMRLWTYFWVTLAAQLIMTSIFANAGTQLARIESIGDVLSPGLIASFALVAAFPLIVNFGYKRLKASR